MAESPFYPHGLFHVSGVPLGEVIDKLSVEGIEKMSGDSSTVSPEIVKYTISGQERTWDIVASKPEVTTLQYHTDHSSCLLMRQFRPAVYAEAKREAEQQGLPEPPLDIGFAYELCSGILENGKSKRSIASADILSQSGFKVPEDNLELVSSFSAAIGISGVTKTLFFTEVNESIRESKGGGDPSKGEFIEVLGLPFDQLDYFISDGTLMKSAALCFGFLWLQKKFILDEVEDATCVSPQ